MIGKLLSVFAATLAVASAYTQPVGDPQGNPIYKPGLDEQVPAGQPYTITWTPTTQDTVTLLLLQGPSNNVVPLYPIAESIDNTGTYVWTPSTDLPPGTSGYGIQLICDDTGEYQYSTQFGISNPNYSGSSNSSSTASSNTTMSTTSSSMTVLSTGMPANSSSILQPTSAMTVPTTLQTGSGATAAGSATSTSTRAVSTGAAGRLGVSVGGAVAALAVAVAAF